MGMSAAQLIAEIIETAKAHNRPPPSKAGLIDLPVSILRDILAVHQETDRVNAPPKPGKARLTKAAPKVCKWAHCSKEFRPAKGTSTVYCSEYCQSLAEIAARQYRTHGTEASLERVLQLKAKIKLRLKRRALNQQNEKD